MDESVLIMRIFMYSAKKNIAKGPPANSTLKPETSSDSPSARSNGVRFVSARVDTNHIMARGQSRKIIHVCSWEVVKFCSVKLPENKIAFRRISARVTS